MFHQATPIPLAERMRPKQLEDLVGQRHLLAAQQPLFKAVKNKQAHSMLLWGPPGVGKTSLARLLADAFQMPFMSLSAIESGVKEIRACIAQAQQAGAIVLFIDEIHRFNKSQQDSLLAAVEKGLITLIGATTENPSFEVISPLLSRCQVYILEALQESDLQQVVHQAMDKDAWLKEKAPIIQEWEALFRLSGGDARKLLNTLELVVSSIEVTPIVLTNAVVMEVVQQKMALYDKTGEQHYDIISAFIKSIRGSDPNAAVYWLARMVAGGEDPTFIARRMLILASEDIGNANPNALLLAQSCFQSVSVIGWPESRIILSQCAIYLACSAKSNASYMAIEDALAQVKATGDLPVPLALRNAPTKLMKNIGYGADYQYAHAYENNFVAMEFMPNGLEGRVFYEPGNNAQEEKMKQFLKNNWKEKYQ